MKKDGSWSEFFSDPVRFADAINGFGCNGEQIVTAEDLQEADTQIRGVKMPKFVNQFSAEKAWGKPKFRDLAQKVAMGINF
ncbi:MAG: hypothetical protein IJZ53_03785 [Tyzzerella sp.]|nr:hypothetical protein [Tyzzerella sp.]